MTAFTLRPVDAWFFRDGRPYNMSEASQTGVVSLFPPHAPTVLGALRAAFARANGWQPPGSWAGAPALREVLGDGPDDLGALRFRGPYLLRRSESGDELLWPLPAHILGKRDGSGDWQAQALLAPSDEPVPTDLGDIHVPVPTGDRASGKPLKGARRTFVTAAGLGAVLRGRLPDAAEVAPAADLWQLEPRVGIVRDEETRTTGENAMYSPLMVRLQPGVALVAELAGVPASWNQASSYIPLGGESRLAVCARFDGSLALPDCDQASIRSSKRVAVVHLSPARFAALPEPGQPLPGMPGTRVVCACLPPPVHIGGWSSLRRRPLPLTPHVAPGSVWFCDIDDDAIEAVLRLHDTQIGERREHGLGHIALGVWPVHKGDNRS